jgi:pimeloyl-ACP methyl ester carboxylesterase
MSSQTIVFIHGLFMTRDCWEPWVSRYEAQGQRCAAIAWPGRDQPVAALRQAHPDPRLASLTLREVVEHHERAIRALPEKPLIIGHSMGGLIAQILLGRGLAAAAVAIDSAPPLGVLTARWSFFKANWPALNLLRPAGRPHLMSFEAFQYAFVNGMPLAEQRAAYERYVVPESLRVARGALTGLARIDFKKPRGPLLLVAGEIDHIVPASLNRSNVRRYRPAAGLTEFKEFAGRNHFLLGQPGWEEVADYSLEWLARQGAERQLAG